MAVSTSDNLPVIIKVPLKRSTNPRYTSPALIATSLAITADSGGVTFKMPIAELSKSISGLSPSFL